MEQEERKALAALPDRLTIYRGVHIKKGTLRGLSWTLDRERAEWFANRWAKRWPYLVEAEVLLVVRAPTHECFAELRASSPSPLEGEGRVGGASAAPVGVVASTPLSMSPPLTTKEPSQPRG